MFKLKIVLLLSLLFSSGLLTDEPYVDKTLLSDITDKHGVFAKKRFFFLQETLDSVKDKGDLEKLEAVNNFYNEVRYASDMKI
jgi:hypothetical protein